LQTSPTDRHRRDPQGHNASDARAKALLQTTLQRYGVSDKAALPINFTGIAMQAGEKYGNQVFDRH